MVSESKMAMSEDEYIFVACCMLNEALRDKWGKAWRLLPLLVPASLVGRVHSFPSDPHVFA